MTTITNISDPQTLKLWAESYFAARTTKTKDFEKKAVENHVLKYIGEKKITEITGTDISKIYASMKQKGLSDGTVLAVDSSIFKLFENAVEQHLIEENPINSIKRPTFLPKEIRPLSNDETNKIYECAKESVLGNLYILILETGLKSCEALALSWEDIDYRQNVIRVHKEINNIASKPSIGDTANHGKIIEMTANVSAALKAEKKAQEKRAEQAGEFWNNTHNFVFTNSFGYLLSHNYLTAESKNMKRRTGIKDFSMTRLSQEFRIKHSLL